jgi:acyltransferase
MGKRILWIDYAKFIGIYLVVLGHGNLSELHTNFIYSFHIPLFFLLSGYLFSEDKYANYKVFLRNKTQQLLLPYFVFNIITFLLWLIFSRDRSNEGFASLHSYRPVLGMFYGNGIDDFMIHAVSLWFIICLFTVEHIYFAFFSRKQTGTKVLLMVLFAIIGYADHVWNLPRLPWGVNIALTAVVFFAIGNTFKIVIKQYIELRPIFHAVLFLLFFIAVYGIAVYNSRVDINLRMYGNYYPLYYLGGVAGSLMVLSFSKLLSMLWGNVKLVMFIARNTIPIIAFNFIVYHLLSRILPRLTGSVGNPMPKGDLPANILLSILVLVFLLPVMWLSEKAFAYFKKAKPVAKKQYQAV